MTIIYGIDIEKSFSPEDVRDAIVECFTQAHREQLADFDELAGDATTEEIEQMKRINVRQIVRKAFEDYGGNYDSPNKESILGTMEKLAEFSENFRNQEIVQKHYKEINKLVNNLK